MRYRTVRYLTLAATLAGLAATAIAEDARMPITIGVSPPRVELEIGEAPASEAVRVFNFGSLPAEISVSVHAFSLDADNRVRIEAPTEQSLDQWMIVSPTRFTVASGEYQTVRLAVRPRVAPDPGEHRAILYFEQAPSGAGPVRIVGRLGVAIYGYAGEIRRLGRLHGVDVRSEGPRPAAFFDISSEGSAHVRLEGGYTVRPAVSDRSASAHGGPTTGPIVGSLPTLPVLPGFRRRVPLHLSHGLPPGDYVLDVDGKLGEKDIALEIPFTVGVAHGPRAAAE